VEVRLKVFLSHSAHDRSFVVGELRPFLMSHGYEPWACEHDIPVASYWENHILKALKACDRFVVVLTPSAIRSEWVRAEVHWACERMKGRVIPLLLRDCDPAEIHLRLIMVQGVDYRDGVETGRARLLAALDAPDYGELDEEPALTTMTSALPTVVAAALPRACVVLKAERGPFAGQEFRLEIEREVTIGRHRGTCTLRLADTKVSRVHARIEHRPGDAVCDLWVEDMDSANGTLLNGRRIRTAQPLRNGDTLEVGESVLKVERSD
jgi:hypothetical protein